LQRCVIRWLRGSLTHLAQLWTEQRVRSQSFCIDSRFVRDTSPRKSLGSNLTCEHFRFPLVIRGLEGFNKSCDRYFGELVALCIFYIAIYFLRGLSTSINARLTTAMEIIAETSKQDYALFIVFPMCLPLSSAKQNARARDANDLAERIFEATKQNAANAQRHFNWSPTPPSRRRQQ